MQLGSKLAWLIAAAACLLQVLHAQDLAPRAYALTPLHGNALTVTYGFYDGSLLFNGALPITNATGKYNVPVLSYYHSFKMFGHFANVVAGLPYAVGTFQGDFKGEPGQIYRSGLVDSTYRLAVNLKGGPPLEAPEFRKWKQKTIIGISLKVVAPTGQYDPAKARQLGRKPLGVQAGAGLFGTVGQGRARWLWRRLVLHSESPLLHGAQSTVGETGWGS